MRQLHIDDCRLFASVKILSKMLHIPGHPRKHNDSLRMSNDGAVNYLLHKQIIVNGKSISVLIIILLRNDDTVSYLLHK